MQIISIPVDHIAPNPLQPRTDFDEAEIAALALSIGQNGLLQPVTVRLGYRTPSGEAGYFLVAGERRWRATTQLGATNINAIVRDVDGIEGGVLAAIENLDRVNLKPLEEASWLVSLFDAAQRAGQPMTTEQMGKKLGTKRGKGWIQRRLDLLDFDDDVKAIVRDVPDSLSVAPLLQSIRNPEKREIVAKAVRGTRRGKTPFVVAEQLTKAAVSTLFVAREIAELVDLWERQGNIEALQQRIGDQLGRDEAHRRSQSAPDAQSASDARSYAQNGTAGRSRGERVTGATPRQMKAELDTALREAQRHLQTALAWKGQLSEIPVAAQKRARDIEHLVRQLAFDEK